MKRKAAKRTIRRAARPQHQSEHYLMVVRGWMFVVAFALMLGVGAVVGTTMSTMLNAGEVAGVTVEMQ